MALALRGPSVHAPAGERVTTFALANDLDLRVTVHVGDGYWGKSGPIRKMYADGQLSDRITYVHCCTLGDDELQMIADSGGTASVAPNVEIQMGHGYPATGRLLKHGIRPTFSIDVCSSNGGHMFGTMRTALGMQRALDNAPGVENRRGDRAHLPLVRRRHPVRDPRRSDGRRSRRPTRARSSGKAADIVVLDDSPLGMIR